MTKDIKQIQEENRKLIASALNNDIILMGGYSSAIFPLTLSRVLLALDKTKNKFMITSGGYICELDQFIGGEEWQNYCYWDLQKETLEQQAPETQIAINQLLTK